MPPILRYVPPPNKTKLFAWLLLPLLYFVLPRDGIEYEGYVVSRIVAAVSLHLPILLAVSLVNLLRQRGTRDAVVMAAITALSVLIVINIIAVLVTTGNATTAKHILSMQAAVFVGFHVWTLWYPDFLRDYYAWPWARLPKGLRLAGVIRGLAHVLVLVLNEALIPVLPDFLWVIVAGLLPVLAVVLSDMATVAALFGMGMRPRGYDPAGEELPLDG